MSDMLTNKAYNYIKHGFDMLYIYPNNLSKMTFFNQKSILIYMRKHYTSGKCSQAEIQVSFVKRVSRNWHAIDQLDNQLDTFKIKWHAIDQLDNQFDTFKIKWQPI